MGTAYRVLFADGSGGHTTSGSPSTQVFIEAIMKNCIGEARTYNAMHATQCKINRSAFASSPSPTPGISLVKDLE